MFSPKLITARQYAINRQIWYVLAILALVDFIWLKQAGIGFDMAHTAVPIAAFFGCCLLSYVYRYIRPDPMLWLAGQAANQLLSATHVLGILSYLTALLAYPLLDARIIAADRFFLFDWRAYVGWVNAAPPGLIRALHLAYILTIPETLLFVGILFFCRKTAHIQRFLIAFIAAALLVVIVAGFMPAVGGYV